MKRPDRSMMHEWHVQINKHMETADFTQDRFMYEAKTASDEIPRLTHLFGLERRGKLPQVHRQCSHSQPEPIKDNHLSCCLGTRCSECPMLISIENMNRPDEEKDFAKAMTCVTHIINKDGDMSGEGYLVTVDDRMYWDRVHKSLASGGEYEPNDQLNH